MDHAPANTWTPIGGAPAAGYAAFSGIFNGNGHTISGMYCSNDEATGLFGLLINGAVINVKLKDSAINRPSESTNPIGGIIGKAQGSYIDSCEVNGFIVNGRNFPLGDTVAIGGIVGHVGLISKTPIIGKLIFNAIPLIAGGYLWNPIINFAAPKVNPGITYVVNCAANDVHITTNKANAASIVGAAETMIMSNCLSTNCTVSSGEKPASAITSNQVDCRITNCYYYNFKLTGQNTNVIDKNYATAISKSTLTSAEFAKKLGAAFEYSKGNAPKLKKIPEGGIKK